MFVNEVFKDMNKGTKFIVNGEIEIKGGQKKVKPDFTLKSPQGDIIFLIELKRLEKNESKFIKGIE
jgi:hypothetical protein